MKLLVQLFFFGIALILTFIAILVWFALWTDSTPQGIFGLTPIDNYSEEDMYLVLIGGAVFPIISIMIYFMLWKTNFFTRNKHT